MKLSKTTVAGKLQQLYRKAYKQVHPHSSGTSISRKEFIGTASLAGASLLVPRFVNGLASNDKVKGSKPSVAIIGGGMAGLNACRILSKTDQFNITLYEASKRTGGRIYTAKGLLDKDLTTELGGEFIDTTHTDMLDLVDEYHLEKYDCAKDTHDNHFPPHTFFFSGQLRREEEIITEFKNIIPKLQADKERMKDDIEAESLDQLSLAEYITTLPVAKWFANMIYWAFTAEFGLDASQLSCLNFIDMIGLDTSDHFQIWGPSDERFKIKGGNQRLPEAMTKSLAQHIRYGHQLTSLYKTGNKTGFQFANGIKGSADYVLLAIPFTILKKVHIDPSLQFPKDKWDIITAMDYGTNSKLLLGFKERLWRKQGSSGYIINEDIQNGWDNSQLQNENKGAAGFTVFLGGKQGKELRGTDDTVNFYKGKLEKIFSGAKAKYNGKHAIMNWSKHPFALGSYACYKTGQWSLFDTEKMREPVGNIYFAGEHCSEKYQGFMNGAAETGRLAAEGILEKVSEQVNK